MDHRAPKTRIFLDSSAAVGEKVRLPSGEAHHIFKVLRARQGEAIEVVTPERGVMLAEVYGDAREARAEILEEIPALGQERTALVTLYQAVPKGKHMDLVVEKATELGVDRIVPLLTEHGEVHPGGEKVERWRRLAVSAARQSLQLRVPEIPEPAGFRQAVQTFREKGEMGIVLHNAHGLPAIEDEVSTETPVGLFVGPEGGWSEAELSLATSLGVSLAQMGPYRLRAETAGVIAVARTESRLRYLEGPANGDVRKRM